MTTTFPAPHRATPAVGTRFPPPVAASRESPRQATGALSWVTAGTALLILLQLGALGAGLDPVGSTISDLFYAPGGSWLLTVSGALTLTGGVILVQRAWRAGYAGAAHLLVIWCVGLAIATLLPTDPPGAAALSAAAEAHRWAAAVMFAATPLAGFLVAGRAAAPASLRRRSWICAVMGLAQFAFCLPSLVPATAAWPAAAALLEVRGLAERVLFVAMIAVLVAVDKAIRGRAAHAGSGTSGATEPRRQEGGYPHCGPAAIRESWRP